MVRGYKRYAALVKRHTMQLQRVVKVDVIQVEEWKHPRISSGTRKVGSDVGACEVRRQQSCRQPASPLVEVAQHDTSARQILVIQYRRVYQLARLMTALQKSRAEVNVENVQQADDGRVHVNAHAASLFAATNVASLALAACSSRPRAWASCPCVAGSGSVRG